MDNEFVPGRDDFPPDEIAMLRQQLAAALAACEAKDAAIQWIQTRCAGDALPNWERGERTYHSRGLILDRTNAVLAIKPDASALKAHDDALIERCAGLINKLEEAKRNPFSREHNNGLQHAIDIIRELKERK